jgi:hypothetical protein
MAAAKRLLMNSQGQTMETLVEMDLALRKADKELMDALVVYRGGTG